MLLLTEGILKKFIKDEDYAKSKKLGMWAMEFDYPWDWRRKN